MERKPSEGEFSTTTLATTGREAKGEVGESGPSGRAFKDGALIAGRYRVLRFIAAGAQGEVYAVEDSALRERVALKTGVDLILSVGQSPENLVGRMA